MLPKDLFKEGFTQNGNLVNIKSLNYIREFIREHLEKRKIINKKMGSGGLKHVVEGSLGKDVSSGDFIAAMILEGYDYKKDGGKSPHAYFNIAQRSVTKLKKSRI